MRKRILDFVIAIMALGLFYVLPSCVISKQRKFLQKEGEQAATFYFKKGQKTKDSVYMKGVIYAGTLQDIRKVLTQNKEITTLVMEDVPGSIDDEINLLASREIRKRGINTYIPKNGKVASGGTDMFLAGKQRNIHPTARLGVHSWSGDEKTALEYPRNHKEHQKYLKYYQEMGIPSDFYWYTLKAAPAESIHWMTSGEIDQYKVITASTPSELDLAGMLSIQKTLSSDEFKGRATGSNQLAQTLIIKEFKQAGLTPFNNSFKRPFTFKERKKAPRTGTNLVGYLKGKKYPNKYIVIGAHYDHLGVVKGVIYNGADDNASGTSLLITLAKYFVKFRSDHSIIFAAFDAEELGLFGSKHFVTKPPVPLSQIVLNLNFDMISRNAKNEIYVVGTHDYPQFKPLVAKAARGSKLKVSYGHDDPKDTSKDYWMHSSDNAAFFAKKIPNITFSEEDHPGYHKPTDDFENIHPDFYKNVAKLILKSIKKIDVNFPTLKK